LDPSSSLLVGNLSDVAVVRLSFQTFLGYYFVARASLYLQWLILNNVELKLPVKVLIVLLRSLQEFNNK